MNLSFGELLVIMAVALLVFGPDKLPEIGKNLGRAVRSFRSASSELQQELGTSLNFLDDEKSKAPQQQEAQAPAPLPPPPAPVMPAEPSAQQQSTTAD